MRMNNKRKSKSVSALLIASLTIWTSFVSSSLWSANLVLNGGTFYGDITSDGKGGFVLSGDAVVMDGAKIDVKGKGDVKVKTRVFSETGKSGLKVANDISVQASHAHIKDSQIIAGKNLEVKAEQDLYVESSQLTAADGTASLSGQTVTMPSGRETREWSESHTDTGFLGLTSSTSVHREKHDTATPTLIEANSVYIKAETLATETTQIKASQGIRFEARQWLNYPAQNHHCISNEDRDSGWFSSSHRNHGHCRTETVHTSLNPGAGKLIPNIQKVGATVGIQPGQSLDQALDQLVSTYPDLLWIKKLRNQHHVQWQTIENNYRGWDNETSGISPLLGVIVSAVVTVATQGVGASLLPAAMSINLIATNAANAAFSTLLPKARWIWPITVGISARR